MRRLALVALLFAGSCNDSSSTPKKLETTQPIVQADAVMLGLEYKQNSITADRRYKGQLLEIDAVRDRIAQSDGKAVVYMHAFHHDYVEGDFICETEIDAASRIPGDGKEVVIHGIGAGVANDVPVLLRCEVAPAKNPGGSPPK